MRSSAQPAAGVASAERCCSPRGGCAGGRSAGHLLAIGLRPATACRLRRSRHCVARRLSAAACAHGGRDVAALSVGCRAGGAPPGAPAGQPARRINHTGRAWGARPVVVGAAAELVRAERRGGPLLSQPVASLRRSCTALRRPRRSGRRTLPRRSITTCLPCSARCFHQAPAISCSPQLDAEV